jgi:hypothetical protein
MLAWRNRTIKPSKMADYVVDPKTNTCIDYSLKCNDSDRFTGTSYNDSDILFGIYNPPEDIHMPIEKQRPIVLKVVQPDD